MPLPADAKAHAMLVADAALQTSRIRGGLSPHRSRGNAKPPGSLAPGAPLPSRGAVAPRKRTFAAKLPATVVRSFRPLRFSLLRFPLRESFGVCRAARVRD